MTDISKTVVIGGEISLILNGVADGKIDLNTTINGQGSIVFVQHDSRYDPYTGLYEIIPTTDDQTLETKDKLMLNDMVIKEIPTYEVSNEYGKTFYIG